MRKITAVLSIGIGLVVFTIAGQVRAGDILQASEFQVTFDTNGHSTPMVGKDSIGYYIVYSQYPVVTGLYGNASIYYQRVANGAALGSPVVVANSPENQWLDDTYGGYIVYTLSPAIGQLGDIILYQMPGSMVRNLTSSGDCWAPRIYGDFVVWIEILPDASGQVMAYQISSGVPVQTTRVGGPIPSASEATVGDRFIVWALTVNGQLDIAAYDIPNGVSFMVANNTTLNEMFPSTEGPWIAYAALSTTSPIVATIQAINVDTGEHRTVADNGAYNVRPMISGNLISYESYSYVLGNWQIFVYRIDKGDTFQVTNNAYNEHLNDIKDNLVTYIDNRYGNDQVFASVLTPVTPPIANAGANQTVHEGSVVTLDGSGSSDPGGNVPLTYAWSFVSVPAGSSAALSDPTLVHPTFTADRAGDYVVRLVVTNSLGTASSPATVTISTYNTPPVADPGPDQAITLIGTTVKLDGSQSYDGDGDPLTYSWTFISKPATSNATLTGANTVTPTFIADVHGTYIIQLVVNDLWVASAPKSVTASFTNIAPVANAGTSQSVPLGDTVCLNGSGSTDPNGDPLTYQWSFVSLPQGSNAVIASPTVAQTSFVPDLQGTYVVQLVVNDGFVNSSPSTVTIQVTISYNTVVQAIQTSLEPQIGSLEPTAFKNANMQNALVNKLNAVIANIEAGNYADALGQLQHDILGKVDGVATIGHPDKNDWITDSSAQLQIYDCLMVIIAEIKALLGQP